MSLVEGVSFVQATVVSARARVFAPECINGYALVNGQCQTDCGTGAAVVSHVRRSSSVSAEAFALDQKVSVAAGTEGMSSKVLYFKHGYSAAATASVDTLFDPSMQQHELGNWTDVYMSATLSDHCGGDVWTAPSAGAYCTGDTVECDQQWSALLHKQIWEADAFEGVHEICVWIRGVCDWRVQNS